MNQALLLELVDKALARRTTFPEILTALRKEGVESYHVDFLRNEYRCYARTGESFLTRIAFEHNGVAPEFSAEKLEAINRRVQAGEAGYTDFVREGAAAGCAHYIVYLEGKKVRYFGRDGGEHVQHFPASR
jgi:uncharacterized protein YbcV (DUF1398 family)